MSNFTEKQQRYIDGRVAGLNRTDSARQAGYSPAGASVQASTLEKRTDIKKAIANGKRSRSHMEHLVTGGAKRGRKPDSDEPRMKSKYKSSLDLLQDTYNNQKMPDSVRLRAAEQALPYEHARIGEKGKKEHAKDLAHKVAGTGNTKRAKFAPKSAPPQLHVVGGKG